MGDRQGAHDLDAVGSEAQLAAGGLDQRRHGPGESLAPAPAEAPDFRPVPGEAALEILGRKLAQGFRCGLASPGFLPYPATEPPPALPPADHVVRKGIQAVRELLPMRELGAADLRRRQVHAIPIGPYT